VRTASGASAGAPHPPSLARSLRCAGPCPIAGRPSSAAQLHPGAPLFDPAIFDALREDARRPELFSPTIYVSSTSAIPPHVQEPVRIQGMRSASIDGLSTMGHHTLDGSGHGSRLGMPWAALKSSTLTPVRRGRQRWAAPYARAHVPC